MMEDVTTPAGHADDFYEDDEPIEKIAAIFARGEKVLTTPPPTPTFIIQTPSVTAGWATQLVRLTGSHAASPTRAATSARK